MTFPVGPPRGLFQARETEGKHADAPVAPRPTEERKGAPAAPIDAAYARYWSMGRGGMGPLPRPATPSPHAQPKRAGVGHGHTPNPTQ